MSDHYQKYRNTIRKVARRHRRLKDKWINEQLRGKSCKYCAESEIVVLKFYPDDRTNRSESQKISYRNKDHVANIIATDKTLDLALLKTKIRPKTLLVS